MESEKYNKPVNMAKKKKTHRYRDYQWDGRREQAP